MKEKIRELITVLFCLAVVGWALWANACLNRRVAEATPWSNHPTFAYHWAGL
jgi:hypothetical protein